MVQRICLHTLQDFLHNMSMGLHYYCSMASDHPPFYENDRSLGRVFESLHTSYDNDRWQHRPHPAANLLRSLSFGPYIQKMIGAGMPMAMLMNASTLVPHPRRKSALAKS